VPVFLNDETELKAIARSNPSLMVIQKGIVKGKYPTNSTPSVEWLKKNCLKGMIRKYLIIFKLKLKIKLILRLKTNINQQRT
jgi:hypothetical protein